jgi:outer membrane biosynthesis protein TonB
MKNRPERAFWIGLTCAALLHAGVIVGITQSKPRYMGERDGNPDALSVEILDAAEFRSRSTVPLQAPTPSPETDPPAPTKHSPAQPPAEAPVPPPAAPPAPSQKTTALAIEKEGLEPAQPPAPREPAKNEPPPAPPEKPSEHAAPVKPKPQPKPEQKSKQALQLDLSPRIMSPAPRSAAATRPPDITRSGENDEFGRKVIQALRQTMPSPNGTLGRVTVHLLLSDKGNLAELQLVRGAADPILTQNVMFAVRQASFPLPPVGATRSDRSFLVTYVYH